MELTRNMETRAQICSAVHENGTLQPLCLQPVWRYYDKLIDLLKASSKLKQANQQHTTITMAENNFDD